MTLLRRPRPPAAGPVTAGGPWSELARLGPLFLVVATALYLTCMLAIERPDGGAEVAWLDVWFHNGLRVAAGGVALLGASRCGFDRAGWWVVGSALSVNAVANIVWVQVFDSAALSLADPLFLAYYPQMYVAVIILARRRAAARGAGQWLDGAVAGLGVAAVVAAFVFPTLLSGATGSALAIAVNVSYPLADLLLVAVLLAGLAPVGWRPDRALAVLIVGLLVTAVADVAYLLQSAAETYTPSSPANHFWILGYVITSLAGWLSPRQLQPRAALSLGSGLLLPAASAVTAVVLLVIGTRQAVLGVAVALAALTLTVAGLRVGIAFAELKSLALSRLEARTDELTRLPNRRAFLELVERSVATLREGRTFSVLLIDLDGFKEVNDTLGHHAGDSLLAGLAGVLQRHLRPTDQVARLGGDEFAVFLGDTYLTEAEEWARSLREALAEPVQVANMAIAVGASIGVSNAPTHARDTHSLMRFADIAMYRAKQTRTGVQVYEQAGDTANRDRLELAQDIRYALPREEIVLHYQPKIDLVAGRVAGTEALARWIHPSRGLLLPDTFLPLVEQADLLQKLTRSVLTSAVRQLADWRARGIDWTVAVNIAPPDLLDESLPEFVTRLLARNDVPASMLVLEITEGSLVADPVRAARTVRRLREAGTQISLDDFGVGFSSLVHLRTLQFDEIKLDRTLAADLEHDERGRAIASAAVGLAEALGMRLVVEGIETTEGRDAVAALGARYIQGFVYCRPLPAADLEAWAQMLSGSQIWTVESSPPDATRPSGNEASPYTVPS